MRVDFDVRGHQGDGLFIWRFSTAWYDCSARLSLARFAFPLQFITALEWAGLFTCCYSCAASTDVNPEKRFLSASLHQALAGSAWNLGPRWY